MENNANPCGEFGNHCCYLSEVQEIAAKLTFMYSAIWNLIRSTLSGVWAERGHPCGLLSFTDPSWCHFSPHHTTVLQPEHHIFESAEKPHCVTVTDSVLIIPPLLQCGVALTIASFQLNSKHHCTWWWSVWKCHIASTQVFRFQKLLGVFHAPCNLVYVVPCAAVLNVVSPESFKAPSLVDVVFNRVTFAWHWCAVC